MATGGSSARDNQRVVLLGRKGAGKSSLAKRLGHAVLKTEERGLCVRRQGEHSGKKLIVVDTPGWDRVSVQRTPEQIEQEIIRSTSLCLPGPHALLLFLPISMDGDPPSANEMKSASHHVELLSPRAWRHTMVVFVCKDEMDESIIHRHVQGAKKLTDKCEGRYLILQRDSQVTELLQKIEDIVEDNYGDFLIPQISYEVLEKREEELKQWCRSKIEDMELKFKDHFDRLEQEVNDYKTRKRRGSKESPPELAEASPDSAAVQRQDSEKDMVELQTVRHGYHEEIMTIIRYYMKPSGVILMAVIGALIGSLVGATDGVRGSCVGMIFGSMISALLAIVYFRSTRLVRSSGGVALVIEDPRRKRTGSLRSPKTNDKPQKQ